MRQVGSMIDYKFSKKCISRTAHWSLTIPTVIAEELFSHIFQGDQDEHGAIIKAGISYEPNGMRLLAREVVTAQDGVDYVPGKYGYRMLKAEFVTKHAIACRNEKLVYLAVHNHGGKDFVEFSRTDLASQQRGYPALLDVMSGRPVGALVFAKNAVAGRLWLSVNEQIELESARLVGPSVRYLFPRPRRKVSVNAKITYDRQARIFGDRGQEILSSLKVGIIGAGGVGSLLVEYLARLGVGNFVIVDPDRLDITNLSRVTGATRFDAMVFLTRNNRPEWIRKIGKSLSAPKVKIMNRIIKRANNSANVEIIKGDFVDDSVARRFTNCDYLFLAADSAQARLVFNAIVYGYLIPGVQVGTKVDIDKHSGSIENVFTVSRPVTPMGGCLWCNGLIPTTQLQKEAENKKERSAQRYVDEENVVSPSVITLNATATGQAVNDFLFSMLGLSHEMANSDYYRNMPRCRKVIFDEPRSDDKCPFCSIDKRSMFARGDMCELPTRC